MQRLPSRKSNKPAAARKYTTSTRKTTKISRTLFVRRHVLLFGMLGRAAKPFGSLYFYGANLGKPMYLRLSRCGGTPGRGAHASPIETFPVPPMPIVSVRGVFSRAVRIVSLCLCFRSTVLECLGVLHMLSGGNDVANILRIFHGYFTNE